jgi:hypothetical protein
MRKRRELLVGQIWKGNNLKCQNLGGSKEILALSIVTGRPHESRIVFLDQRGRKTWCSRASFVNWISAYSAYIWRYVAPEPGPSVVIEQSAWDGWEAFAEDRPLVRATGDSPVEAFDGVMTQLAV